MKLTRTILALAAAVLALPITAIAQSEDLSADLASANEANGDLVVASQKSARDLRRDLWRAEKDFYSIYNKLNDDSNYDVVCTKEAPTGSMIKTQVCRPKFLTRAFKEGKIKNAAELESNAEIAGKVATFRNNLATLAAENPDLKAAAATLNLAHARVMADKEKRASN